MVVSGLFYFSSISTSVFCSVLLTAELYLQVLIGAKTREENVD